MHVSISSYDYWNPLNVAEAMETSVNSMRLGQVNMSVKHPSSTNPERICSFSLFEVWLCRAIINQFKHFNRKRPFMLNSPFKHLSLCL